MMKKRTSLLALLALLSIIALSAADFSSADAASDKANGNGRNMTFHKTKNTAGASPFAGSGNLVYHGGPVMHTNITYAIYWVPAGYSVSSGYQSVINGFFQNVAAASGKTSNVYYSDTQYYDGSGNLAYSSTFGGSYLDTNPFPASGCTDSVSQTSICLSDAQIQAEIARVMAANGWTAGSNKLYFMFTAKGVGSCYDAADCAFSQYCAYHSNFTNSGTVLYANQPYADTVPSNCDAGQHPNGDDADATLNVASHEHNEAITDPLGTAWYDNAGYENGDKCAWTFGSALGSTASGQYNQVIGTGKYYLQREWSNSSRRCVLTGK